MRVKKMGWFLRIIMFNRITGITLAPFGIYIKEEYLEYDFIIRHESIHWKQQVEMLFIFFYLWYFVEWLIKLLTPPMGAYKDISFEREAKDYRYDITYLELRKPYAWIKYIVS